MKKNIKITILFFSLFFVGLNGNLYSHPAWGIVVDRNKQIYFSDLETVWKIDAQGKLSVFRAGVSGRHVHDLSIDAQDNIYGIDNSYDSRTETYPRSIWKMSPRGELFVIAPMTTNLPFGMGIWRDSGGNTYSAEPYNNERRESKIYKRTADGKTSLFAGGKYGYLDGAKNKAEFGVITDLAFGKDATIYLTGDDKVRKIDKRGTVSTIYRNQVSNNNRANSETLSKLFGIDVDAQENVLIADFEKKRLLKINSEGKVSTLLDSEKDWSPIGVAASANEIYVLEGRPVSSVEQSGNRVLKIDVNGKTTIILNLKDTIKRYGNAILNNGDLQSETELKKNFAANTADNLTSTNKSIIYYGLIAVTCMGLFAFAFFVWKKSD